MKRALEGRALPSLRQVKEIGLVPALGMQIHSKRKIHRKCLFEGIHVVLASQRDGYDTTDDESVIQLRVDGESVHDEWIIGPTLQKLEDTTAGAGVSLKAHIERLNDELFRPLMTPEIAVDLMESRGYFSEIQVSEAFQSGDAELLAEHEGEFASCPEDERYGPTPMEAFKDLGGGAPVALWMPTGKPSVKLTREVWIKAGFDEGLATTLEALFGQESEKAIKRLRSTRCKHDTGGNHYMFVGALLMHAKAHLHMECLHDTGRAVMEDGEPLAFFTRDLNNNQRDPFTAIAAYLDGMTLLSEMVNLTTQGESA
jgi:hypothetical protein